MAGSRHFQRILLCLAGAAVLHATPVTAEPTSAPAPEAAEAAGAAPAPAPAAAPDGTATASSDEPNERVCRRIEQLGSRLRAVRVCRTAEEWRSLEERARSQVRGLQNRSGNVVDAERGG